MKKKIKNTQNKLKHLIIKPTLFCTANCATCGTRRMLHHNLAISKNNFLTLRDWETIIKDAADLGAEKIDISGGEPMLYQKLVDLIKIAKKYSLYSELKTNGSLITRKKAKKLVGAGLNSILISLYSHDEQRHDTMRNRKGLWKEAIKAIKFFSELQNDKFVLRTQTLIDKINFRDLPFLIKIHINLGVSEMEISYLEGDINGNYLLNKEEIKEFRSKIIPECIEEVNILPKKKKKTAINSLKKFFQARLVDNEWARGIYRPKRLNLKKCSRPSFFSLILANGDVHPCNAVEYTHDPIMGNTKINSFKEIWMNKKYNDFRSKNFWYCKYCPMNLKIKLRFK